MQEFRRCLEIHGAHGSLAVGLLLLFHVGRVRLTQAAPVWIADALMHPWFEERAPPWRRILKQALPVPAKRYCRDMVDRPRQKIW